MLSSPVKWSLAALSSIQVDDDIDDVCSACADDGDAMTTNDVYPSFSSVFCFLLLLLSLDV